MHFCFLRLDQSGLTEKWRLTRKKSNRSLVLVGKVLAADSIYVAISWVVRNQDPINVMFAVLVLTEKVGLTCHQSGACKGADYKKCSVCG